MAVNPGAIGAPSRGMNPMKPRVSEDQPTEFPVNQVDGSPLKPITRVLIDRRATRHFRPDPIPDRYLEAILRFGGQAPSGYNLQPWRFILVRDPANRARLQKAALDQKKVGEAPAVLIAFAIRDEWKSYIRTVFEEGQQRGLGANNDADEQVASASGFLDTIPAAVWLNRHTMIAFTTMMLVAESYGLDTAPMEGFDPKAVKREFGLPPEAEVIALLAIGFADGPEKPYPGRLRLRDFIHVEHYGERWM